jgi:hypothetical protein
MENILILSLYIIRVPLWGWARSRLCRVKFSCGLIVLFLLSCVGCSRNTDDAKRIDALKPEICSSFGREQLLQVASKVDAVPLGASSQEVEVMLGKPSYHYPLTNVQATRLYGWMWFYVQHCPSNVGIFPVDNFIQLIVRSDGGLVSVDYRGLPGISRRKRVATSQH